MHFLSPPATSHGRRGARVVVEPGYPPGTPAAESLLDRLSLEGAVAGRSWYLYIDETGDFNKPGARVAVVGLLVRDQDTPKAIARLKEALAAVYPLVPYPPHAWVLNHPSSRLLFQLAKEPGLHETPAEREVRAACEPAMAAISAAGPPSLKALMEEARQGRFPRHPPPLRDMDNWLRLEAQRAFQPLEALAKGQDRKMRRLLSETASLVGADGLFLVAAVGTTPEEGDAADQATPDAGARDPNSIVRDPYFDLLQTLFERVFCLTWGSKERVWVRVLSRPFKVVGLGRPMHKLLPRHVGQVIQDASCYPAVDEAHRSTARLVPIGSDNKFDEGAHPYLVMADYVANRLRRAAWKRDCWSDLLQRMERTGVLGLSGHDLLKVVAPPMIRPGLSPLPTIAAGGAPEMMVRTAFNTRKPVAVEGLPNDWRREQALAWVESALSGVWP